MELPREERAFLYASIDLRVEAEKEAVKSRRKR